MNKREIKLLKTFNKQIGIDYKIFKNEDTFKFKCNTCGDCCKNREDIILSTYDIYRACKYLDMKPVDFLNKYCEVYIGKNSHLPLVIIKFRESINTDNKYTVCPFNRKKDGKGICAIHQAKPFICLAFPVGRMTDVETKEQHYIITNNNHCGSCDKEAKEYNLNEWFKDFDLETNQKFTYIYNKLLTDIINIIDIEKLIENKKIDEKHKKAFFYQLANNLYYQIDINKDVIEVIEEIKDKTMEDIIMYVYSMYLLGHNITAKNYKIDNKQLEEYKKQIIA